ncbi:Hypothetical predicted protein [Mytilus galloprovincialis]|uniref:Uncharacterized protein n=1 Tax=Mytilus galloprovincialis TaxID=29158 RepID=A0A8B6C072_MYTGA|nr:Hypothetical predicted protein [Mytilus galloprovincialis]
MSDNCSFHCITFALSDPKEKSYRSQCHHIHQDNCDRCSKLETIFRKLEEKINSVIDADLQEELKHDLSQSQIYIHNWKNHIIRSANQNKAKANIISTLSSNQILIFMDWAMKYIPIIDRESQSEWFGKKGLNWHVTAVCQKKSEEEGMKIYCYIHIFDSCTQNWYSVASILEDVLTVVKEKDDTINEEYIRSDNAGCYKSAPLLLSLPGISNRSRINIKRYDFSDAQGGKDICDRRIAPIKQHMKAYANEGHSIKTANQMKKAIES